MTLSPIALEHDVRTVQGMHLSLGIRTFPSDIGYRLHTFHCYCQLMHKSRIAIEVNPETAGLGASRRVSSIQKMNTPTNPPFPSAEGECLTSTTVEGI